MKTLITWIAAFCSCASLAGQTGILYPTGYDNIQVLTKLSDGNLVFLSGGRLTKISVDGDLIWQTDVLIDTVLGYTLRSSSDKSIFEQTGGDLILFALKSVLRTTADGDVISLDPIEGANLGVIAVTRDEHGFQLLSQNGTFPITDQSFYYTALDNALNTRFSYAFPHYSYSGTSSINVVDDKAMFYLYGHDGGLMGGFEEYLQLDTLGVIDLDVAGYLPEIKPDAKGINGLLYKSTFTDTGFTMEVFDKDFDLVGSSNYYLEANILDSLLMMEEMPDGNLVMLYDYYGVDGLGGFTSNQLIFFSPLGEILSTSAEFLHSSTNNFFPSDMTVISSDMLAISGSIFFTATGEGFGCIVFVDTAGIVNGVYYSGTVFQDSNGNNVCDFGEFRVPYPKIESDVMPLYTVGNEDGYYSMFLATIGETSTDWVNLPYWDISEPETYDYLIEPGMFGTFIDEQNFDIGYSTEATDLEISMNDIFIEIPVLLDDTLIRQITVTVSNVGNQVDEDATVALNFMDYFDITSIDPPPAYTTATAINWDIASIDPFESKTFTIQYEIEYDTTYLGTMVTVTGDVTSGGSDVYTPNNHCVYYQPYEYSFDPNNKLVYPQGIGPEGNIPWETEWLQYTINFQNTGDANAHNVRLIDTIDTNLDPASIYILNSSHDMTMTNIAPAVYEWYFPDINLTPMNTDFENSYGSITYKVKLDPSLPLGTVIENNAAIYFDLNEPVITNTTVNTLALIESVNEIAPIGSLRIYPNPACDVIYISGMELALSNAKVHVFDLLGKLVINSNLTDEKLLNVSSLPSGIYTIECEGSTGRFVKE